MCASHPPAAWEWALASMAFALALLPLAAASMRALLCRCRGVPAARMAAMGAIAFAATAFAGTKVVTDIGIRITRCVSDANKTEIDWETNDERIAPGMPFLVQCGMNRFMFATVAQTTASNAVIPGFTVGADRWWRIAVDMGEVQSEGGGE